jgi:hypothetical protein
VAAAMIADGATNGYTIVTCAGTPHTEARSSRARWRPTAGSASGTGTRTALRAAIGAGIFGPMSPSSPGQRHPSPCPAPAIRRVHTN